MIIFIVILQERQGQLKRQTTEPKAKTRERGYRGCKHTINNERKKVVTRALNAAKARLMEEAIP